MAARELSVGEKALVSKGLDTYEAQLRRSAKANTQLEMVAKGFVTEADAVQQLRILLNTQKVLVG